MNRLGSFFSISRHPKPWKTTYFGIQYWRPSVTCLKLIEADARGSTGFLYFLFFRPRDRVGATPQQNRFRFLFGRAIEFVLLLDNNGFLLFLGER